jgi:hypothetical protein
MTQVPINVVGLRERLLPDELRAPSERLRTALALYKDGVAMKRAQLRRQDRAASEEEITLRFVAWLRTRPGAALGDAEGIGRRMTDSP